MLVEHDGECDVRFRAGCLVGITFADGPCSASWVRKLDARNPSVVTDGSVPSAVLRISFQNETFAPIRTIIYMKNKNFGGL
jgi:hypothetical protein